MFECVDADSTSIDGAASTKPTNCSANEVFSLVSGTKSFTQQGQILVWESVSVSTGITGDDSAGFAFDEQQLIVTQEVSLGSFVAFPIMIAITI